MSTFLRSLKLTNFLSFGPQSQEIELTPLNVLIGPNASGKSNFIEALELIHATPTDISDAIRIGGTAGEWLWKGSEVGTQLNGGFAGHRDASVFESSKVATIETKIQACDKVPELRYRLAFTEASSRLEIVDEALENSSGTKGKNDVFFYYRFQNGNPVINVKQAKNFAGRPYEERQL